MTTRLFDAVVPAISRLAQRITLLADAVHNWLNRHWFRLVLLAIMTWVLLQKDLSVQVNLGGIAPLPGKVELAAFAQGENEEELAVTNPATVLPADAGAMQIAYVRRFSKVAREEMQRFGIPASVTLAQGILETQSGKSPLATRNNNHFGIKCFSKSCVKGHCSNFQDDTHKDFFRRYETAWESFRSHSQLLQADRYRALFTLDKRDYKGWARGLSKAGYATDPQYANKLIRIIESLNLDRLDS